MIEIKDILDEDFQDYKDTSIFIAMSRCNWKCCVEQNLDISICQNSELANQKNINISVEEIFNRYISNPITNSIVIGGLEPFLQFEDTLKLIKYFRINKCKDTFVIYTGYYENEISDQIKILKQYLLANSFLRSLLYDLVGVKKPTIR
jgi:organic radical activating enzyme